MVRLARRLSLYVQCYAKRLLFKAGCTSATLNVTDLTMHACRMLVDVVSQITMTSTADFCSWARTDPGALLGAARHKALAAVGMSVESLQQAGTLLALSELVMRYKAPLRAQDIFVVTAAVSKVQGARLVLEQTVLRLPQPQEHSDDSGFTAEPEVRCEGWRILP